MKNSAFPLNLKCAVGLLLCGSGALAHAAQETNAVAPVSHLNPPVVVKSVFTDDPNAGKDPFYPRSARRQPTVEVASVTNTPPPSTLFSQLTLKGISGTKGQRLALINSSTIGVGERAEIRAGAQFVKILCREIRDSSVLIELVGGGEVRELKLRQGI
jgi:hypothetical protein